MEKKKSYEVEAVSKVRMPCKVVSLSEVAHLISLYFLHHLPVAVLDSGPGKLVSPLSPFSRRL